MAYELTCREVGGDLFSEECATLEEAQEKMSIMCAPLLVLGYFTSKDDWGYKFKIGRKTVELFIRELQA